MIRFYIAFLEFIHGAYSSAGLERISDKDEVRGSSPRRPTI